MIEKKWICPLYEIRENVILAERFLSMMPHSYRSDCLRLYEIRKSLETKIEAFAGVLEKKIKDETDDGRRKVLINFKRDIFNQRKKAQASLTEQEAYFRQIGIWQEAEKIMELLVLKWKKEEESKAYVQTAYQDEREKMQMLFKESPLLMNALKYVSPNIVEKARPYFEQESRAHKAKLRKLDYTLLKILSRGTVKTSPFSTLNKVSLALFEKEEERDGGEENGRREQIVTAVSCAFLLRIWAVLEKDMAVIRESSFYLNETAVKEEGIYYWTSLEDKTGTRKKVYATSDTLNKLKENALIDFLFEQCKNKEADTEFTYGKLTEMITDRFGMTAEECSHIVRQLVERKLLVNTYELIEDRNMPDRLIKHLEQFKGKSRKVEEAAEALARMNQSLKVLNENSKEAENCYFAILKEAQRLASALELKDYEEKYVLYQDYVGYGEEKNLSFEKVVYEELFLLQRFLTIFDAELQLNYMIADAVLKKYGSDMLYLDHTENLLNDIINIIIEQSNEMVAAVYMEEPHSPIREVNALREAKNKLLQHLQNGKNTESVVIHQELIDEILNRTDCVKEYRCSNDFFLQQDRGELIINHAYYGYLTYFLRFLDYMPEFLEDRNVKRYIKEVIHDGNYVEIYNHYGFNANIRPAVAKTAIDIPNTRIKERDRFEKIYRFDEIGIRFNEQSKRLDLFLDGEKVKIVFLGSLIKRLLPSLAATLNTFCNNGVSESNISNFYLADYLQNGFEGIQTVPEIRFANHIVLSRKKIVVSGNELKAIFAMQDEEALFAFHIFCMENRISEEFYAYKPDEGKAYQNGKVFPIFEKPQYYNMNSVLFWKLFRNEFETAKMIVIEEARPSAEGNLNEYVVELTSE